MRGALRLGCLVLAMSLMGSAQAEANIWDWIDALDGPGPSRSRGNFMVNILCSGTGNKSNRIFQIPDNPRDAQSCLFVDFRRFRAEEDDRFYPVNITVTEIGPSIRLHPAVELGAGIGFIKMSSTSPVTDEEFDETRLTISFPRVVFKPLVAIPFSPLQNDPDWGFFQMYFRESIIAGELSQNDFASKPGTVFSRRHQRVKSMGFIIEVPSLIRLFRGV